MNKKITGVTDLLKTITLAFILSIFIRTTVAEARFIPSGSMLPTLLIDDRLFIEKVSHYTGSVDRGEIVVFYPPYLEPKNDSFKNIFLRRVNLSKDIPLIKRVIGLPGETIEIKNNTVLINGKPLKENSYIKEAPLYNMPALKIPENEIFVMGDNRNDSADSHIWGTLPVKNIIGHAVFRFWPLKRFGLFHDS